MARSKQGDIREAVERHQIKQQVAEEARQGRGAEEITAQLNRTGWRGVPVSLVERMLGELEAEGKIR